MNLLILAFVVGSLSVCQCFTLRNKPSEYEKLPEVNGTKFYYFGYGSNLLTKRIHMQNPTAVKIGPGLLKDYRLDFNFLSSRWNGSAATIVPHVNRTVQGTLWEIGLENLDDLDNQEGVPDGIYEPFSINIQHLAKNGTITARVYLLVKQPETDLESYTPENIPYIRQPSKTYLQCIVKGAIETGLEESYINRLKKIIHNGNVEKYLEKYLELENVELCS